jgi:hypothetical protein
MRKNDHIKHDSVRTMLYKQKTNGLTRRASRHSSSFPFIRLINTGRALAGFFRIASTNTGTLSRPYNLFP